MSERTRTTPSPSEGSPPGARDFDDVQADVNIILETLLCADRLLDKCWREHGTQQGVTIQHALDAVKRLRADAVRGLK